MAQGLQAFHGEQGAALNTTECNDPAEHGRKAPNKLRDPVLLFQRDRKRTRGTDHLARINTMAASTDHRAAIALCGSLDELEAYVKQQPTALDVVFDVCEYWVYEALAFRLGDAD